MFEVRWSPFFFKLKWNGIRPLGYVKHKDVIESNCMTQHLFWVGPFNFGWITIHPLKKGAKHHV